jgi:serine/threonine protein phosphatase PrpC
MAIHKIENDGTREKNEDRYLIHHTEIVFKLDDTTIDPEKALADPTNFENIVQAIEDKVVSRQEELDHSGSTVTVAGFTKTANDEIQYTTSHAGDSPVLIVQQDEFFIWAITQVTKDDVVPQNPSVLTKALKKNGFNAWPATATSTIACCENMFFIVATDGMGLNNTANKGVLEVFVKFLNDNYISVKNFPAALEKWTNENNNGDNRTAVIVPAADIEEGKTIIVGMFDGHGGSAKVAEAARDAAEEYIVKAQQQANSSFLDTYIYTSEPYAWTLAGVLATKLKEYENVNDITDSTTASFYINGMKPALEKFLRSEMPNTQFIAEISAAYSALAKYKENPQTR